MMGLRTLLLTLTLVGMASAANYNIFGGGCHEMDNTVDSLADTEQGVRTLLGYKTMKLVAWNPSELEKANTCITVTFDLANKHYTMKHTNATGNFVLKGNATIMSGRKNTHLQMTGFEYEIFGGSGKTITKYFPIHIHKTEVGFSTCSTGFIGRTEHIYIFSDADLSSMTDECAKTEARSYLDIDVARVDNSKC